MEIDSVEKAEKLVQLLKEAKKIITTFYAEWCGACKSWTPQLETISKNSSVIVPLAKVEEKNMEMYNNVRTMNNLNPITVEKYPTVMKEMGTNIEEIPTNEVETEATNNNNPVNPNDGEEMDMNMTPVSPPSNANDIMSLRGENNLTGESSEPKLVGGGLYSALASTAYQLAPATLLLATAAATLKCRSKKSKKGKKSKKSKKSRKY